MTDDSILVEHAIAGDEGAFAQIVERYTPRVYRFCMRLLGSSDRAQDATQETFVKAWKHLDRIDTEKPLAPWLFAIARNASIDLERKQRSFPFSLLPAMPDGTDRIAETLPDPEPLPDEVFERKQLGVQMQEALARRPARERALLSLRYEEELSFEEIAQALSLPASTVRSIHRRALAALRTDLMQRNQVDGRK